MKPPVRENQKGFSLNLTPMLDVIFQLVIFFLVSSNLIQQEVSMPLQLPEAKTLTPAAESENRKITLNVPAAGQVYFGNMMLAPDTLPEQLSKIFRREQEQRDGAAELRIRINKDVPYGTAAPILVQAAKSGIWKVSFAVNEKRD
ncbi:protein TolR [Planctomycetales bacterium]|nr:protein TolR [Planctomycetales bacterium]GHT34889.1 protein TolR [Planctomycetales bacterium]